MPEIDYLQPRLTSKVYYLSTIFYNKGTINSTYSVYNDIQLSKLGYSKDKDVIDFSSYLQLVQGNQKTTKIIWSIKAEQRLMRYPFNRQNQILGPLVYFYIL